MESIFSFSGNRTKYSKAWRAQQHVLHCFGVIGKNHMAGCLGYLVLWPISIPELDGFLSLEG
jgi:hypothetical protein